MADDPGNGWSENKRLVRFELDEHRKDIDRIEWKVNDVSKTVDKLPGRIAIAALVVLIGIAADITVKVVTERHAAQRIDVPPEVNRLIQLLEEDKARRNVEVNK